MDNDNRYMNVALYLRVAYPDLNQVTSTELLCRNMLAIIESHRTWRVVDTYIDHGKNYKRMENLALEELLFKCRSGNIDLIVTPSFSRFGCDPKQAAELAMELSVLPHPVGIWFTNDLICTLDPGWTDTLKNQLMPIEMEDT